MTAPLDGVPDGVGEATPEMVAAAWRAFRGERKGMLLGPGPGFKEAIDAALALRPAQPEADALREEVGRLRTENDGWLREVVDRFNDLGRLLLALGFSDHARPISSAKVFDLCLREIEGLRQRIPDAEADALRLHREKMDALDRLAASDRALAEARGVLRQVEWGSSATDPIWGSDEPACPYCGQIKIRKHFDGCALAAALTDKQSDLSLSDSTADLSISDNGLAPKNSGEVTADPGPGTVGARTGGDGHGG